LIHVKRLASALTTLVSMFVNRRRLAATFCVAAFAAMPAELTA
jgi:hypothetical protein